MIDLNNKIVTDDGRKARALHSTWGKAAMPGGRLVLVVVGMADYALMYEDGSGRYIDENLLGKAVYFHNVEPEKNLVKVGDTVKYYFVDDKDNKVLGAWGDKLWIDNKTRFGLVVESKHCLLNGRPIDGWIP